MQREPQLLWWMGPWGIDSTLLLPPSAPFSAVKQEQLSPRAQTGASESLGMPTAQETSVLQGEARAPLCLAPHLPQLSSLGT